MITAEKKRKSSTRESSVRSTSGFGERNIRPRKRVLADNYLYCDHCDKYSTGLCPQGCQSYEANRKADHAKHTVPAGVRIAGSNLLKAGMGAFAVKTFAKNTFFGPYTGQRHRSAERANQSGYAWTIEDVDGNVYNYIDATDPRRSNWLRYVNCPNRQEDENLSAVQFNGELYYQTTREIQAGEELFVYYGEEYAKALGIPAFKYPADDYVEPAAPQPIPRAQSASMVALKTRPSKLQASKKRKRSNETVLTKGARD